MYLTKGLLYDNLLERIEENFIDEYSEDKFTNLEDVIESTIDFYWRKIINAYEYRHIDENILANNLKANFMSDIDEQSLVDEIDSNNDSYWGESNYERNNNFFF